MCHVCFPMEPHPGLLVSTNAPLSSCKPMAFWTSLSAGFRRVVVFLGDACVVRTWDVIIASIAINECASQNIQRTTCSGATRPDQRDFQFYTFVPNFPCRDSTRRYIIFRFVPPYILSFCFYSYSPFFPRCIFSVCFHLSFLSIPPSEGEMLRLLIILIVT